MCGTWWNSPNSNHAFGLSVISLVVTVFAAVGGIIGYMSSGSSLVLVYGLENMVDFLSSAVVLWRFYCPSGADEETEKLLARREKRASIAISFILGLLGIFVIGAAAVDFAEGQEESASLDTLILISFFSILIFGAMSLIKFRYSVLLRSASLHKDGICSLIGTVLAVSLFINTAIIEEEPSLWWTDPLVACLAGVVAFGVGVHAVFMARWVQGLPIFTFSWWVQSQGDGMDEVTGRDLKPEDYGQTELPAKTPEQNVV